MHRLSHVHRSNTLIEIIIKIKLGVSIHCLVQIDGMITMMS